MDSPNPIPESYESTENALMDAFKGAAINVTNLYRECGLGGTSSSWNTDHSANHHHQVHDAYKSAAVKVTGLYREAIAQNRKAYSAGYQQALQDLYEFISSHPGIAMMQPHGSAASLPVEQGYLHVQDILQFARQQSTVLASESISTISQLNTPSLDSQPAEEQSGGHHPHPISTPYLDDPSLQERLTLAELPSLTTALVPEPTPDMMSATIKNPSHNGHGHPQALHTDLSTSSEDNDHSAYHLGTGISSAWGHQYTHGQDSVGDGLKRRFTFDPWIDPPVKRGRR